MILDACFLIDLLADDSAAVAKLDEIQDELLAVPTLTYTEVGVGIDPASEERQRFEDIMERVSVVPYDVDAARRAVAIQRQLRIGDADRCHRLYDRRHSTRVGCADRHLERR